MAQPVNDWQWATVPAREKEIFVLILRASPVSVGVTQLYGTGMDRASFCVRTNLPTHTHTPPIRLSSILYQYIQD